MDPLGSREVFAPGEGQGWHCGLLKWGLVRLTRHSGGAVARRGVGGRTGLGHTEEALLLPRGHAQRKRDPEVGRGEQGAECCVIPVPSVPLGPL